MGPKIESIMRNVIDHFESQVGEMEIWKYSSKMSLVVPEILLYRPLKTYEQLRIIWFATWKYYSDNIHIT